MDKITTYKCKICGKKMTPAVENQVMGTDFVTYGHVCEKCLQENSKERIAELLNIPGVVKIV